MSRNARSEMPGSRSVRAANAMTWRRSTAPSCRLCPKVNSRRKIPNVEAAYTPPNNTGVPPARIMSTSSMLSAPVNIPPMIEVSFPTGLTAPDFTRVLGTSTHSPINSESPACSASSNTGTNPADDTRFSSSNTADSSTNLWNDFTESAF